MRPAWPVLWLVSFTVESWLHGQSVYLQGDVTMIDTGKWQIFAVPDNVSATLPELPNSLRARPWCKQDCEHPCWSLPER